MARSICNPSDTSDYEAYQPRIADFVDERVKVRMKEAMREEQAPYS